MKPKRLLFATLLSAGLVLSAAPACAQEAVRPEIARPLKAAGDLYRAGKYRDALAKVREADSVPNRTAAEQITIERMRGSAALAAGDNETAVRAFERALASGKVSAGEQAKIAEALAGAEYRAGHYAKAIQWARQASASPAMRQLIIQSSFQMGDYASVVRETAAEVQADEQAGRRPSDDKLHLLASAYQRMNNSAGYAQTVEKLLAYYPKKEYWLDLLARLPRKPGFSDRLSLDVYRLQLATGNMTKPSDYMEAAQLALQAGLATEGRQIVEKGFGSGVLGTGPEAERQKRLRELAIKQESEAKANLPKERAEAETAKDGNGLIKVGYAYVTMGQVDQGIELIEKGLAKGGLKRPEDAKLRLGLAQLQSPKTKAKAAQTLRSVQGNDGTADIARLWAIYANQPHS